MFATADIAVPGRMALAIPRRAVIHLGDTTVVYVHRGENAERKERFLRVPVVVDEDVPGDLVAVKRGLTAGDEIVTAGSLLLTSS
jgi:multidrug efflux pump subunit AcrA (membrane-fusion protein)